MSRYTNDGSIAVAGPAGSVTLLAATILVLSGCLGCASTQSRYEEAAGVGTVEAYQRFIDEHPKSPLADDARRSIETIAWGEAQETGTIEGYEEFQRRFPSTEHPAGQKIEELHWIDAEAEGTPEAVDAFLDQYPEGRHAGDAQRWLDVERDWQRLESSSDLPALRDFVSSHGENRYSGRAAERIAAIEHELAIQESLGGVSLEMSSDPLRWEVSRNAVLGFNGARMVATWEHEVEDRSPAPGHVFLIGHLALDAQTEFECDMSSDVGVLGGDGNVYRSFTMVLVPKEGGREGEGEVGWTGGAVQSWNCRPRQESMKYMVCFELPGEAAAGAKLVFFGEEYALEFTR